MTIENRLRRLQARIMSDKKPLVILTFQDGTQRSMNWVNALSVISSGANVTHVQYPDETGCSLLTAMLPFDGSPDYWDDLAEVE